MKTREDNVEKLKKLAKRLGISSGEIKVRPMEGAPVLAAKGNRGNLTLGGVL